jgi:hypothetical protein
MSENNKAVVKKEKPDAPMEWRPREEVAALADRLKAMMPGTLNKEEALSLAQYSAALDANPFRGEVYAYERRGKLQIVEGYKLLVRWARRQCNFSERYERMSGDELDEGDIGYRCYILRDDAKGTLQTFVEAGAQWDEAFKTAAQSSVGVVKKSEHSNRPAPTGWTWDEVARKRALKNSLNRAYGAPSPREIAKETWMVGDVETTSEDWDKARANLAPSAGPEETARLAARIAEQGEEAEFPTDTAIPAGGNRDNDRIFKEEPSKEPEEVLEANAELLHGNADDQAGNLTGREKPETDDSKNDFLRNANAIVRDQVITVQDVESIKDECRDGESGEIDWSAAVEYLETM